jgi:hypothetical protein
LKNFFLILIGILVIPSANNFSQSFGFGCLGFVGGYGGYSFQRYEATGLNNYIAVFNEINQDSLSSPLSDFKSASGYRVGLNFFRTNLEGLILTAKGYYQSIGEKHSAQTTSIFGTSNTTYELEIRNWGIGVDLGTSITSSVSWKVLDAALIIYNAEFTSTLDLPGSITNVANYQTEKTSIGYSIGTGFILNIIDDYVTLEGLAAFTVLSIEGMQTDEGNKLTTDELSAEPMRNFIEAGGFNAVLQLNIGIPL